MPHKLRIDTPFPFVPQSWAIDAELSFPEVTMIKFNPARELTRKSVRALCRDDHGADVARQILVSLCGVRTVNDIPFEKLRDVRDVCDKARTILELKDPGLQRYVPKPPPRILMPAMKIAMMLHFATTIAPFAPEPQRRSNAYVTFIKELLAHGMVVRPTKKQRREHPGWAYKATPKGQAYVEALKKVPLPVRTGPEWVVPSK